MVDFHSHILPGIDDGSKNIQMTEQMLRQGAAQGIDTFVATPHFYPERVSIERFLRRREEAFELTVPVAQSCGIRLFRGAEVALCPGLGRGEGIEQVCVVGTNLMLVEMPFRPWTSRDLKELEYLLDRDIQPIMAHLERFIPIQPKKYIEEILDLPVYVQLNAECFLQWRTRGKPLKLLREGRAHLLGSDCHNLTNRKVNLAQGRQVVERKLGRSYLREIDRLGDELLAGVGTEMAQQNTAW